MGVVMVTFLRWLLVFAAIPALACAAILYTPISVIDSLDAVLHVASLHSLRTDFQMSCEKILPWAGTLTLVAAMGLFVLCLTRTWHRRKQRERHRLVMLQQTSLEQRYYLQRLMETKQPLDFPLLDPIVQELRRGKILNVGGGRHGNLYVQPHRLYPWARTLLEQNPELLETEEEYEKADSGKIRQPFRVCMAV
jgi:hypothetical protein